MKRIPRNSITVIARQREKHDPAHIISLRDSILSKGLLHPPVVRPAPDGGWILVAGEGRLQAIDRIATEEARFVCHDELFPPGDVPVTLLSDLTDTQYKEAEFEENFIRSDLSWQDRCRAIDEIHRLRTEADPSQTRADTARELAAGGGVVSIAEGAASLTSADRISKQLIQASVIAQNLHDPAVRNARNAAEAFQHIIQQQERRHAALLYARSNAAIAPLVEVRKGSLFEILPELEASTYDLILADPPYGNDAGSPGARSRTIHHHNYDDDPTTARKICQHILIEGFRVARPRANCLIFTDIELFDWLKSASLAAGWVPFRTPIIWQKSKSEGLAPWGRQGFRRTYDLIFFATKGQRGLIQSPVDILSHPRVPRDDREYAAEKPVELLEELIKASTLPGDAVLDPCCGSGSALVAAKRLRRRGLGIEIDESAVNISLARLAETSEQTLLTPEEEKLPQLDSL